MLDAAVSTPSVALLVAQVITDTRDERRGSDVEVVGNLSSEPMDLHSWQVQRFDVAWESGRWALVGYSGGRFGPDSRTNMTPAPDLALMLPRRVSENG